MRTVFCVVTLTVLLTGCAFTVHDVKVDYKYDKGTAVNLSASKERVLVKEFRDGRSTATPRMIVNATNLNGNTTTGGWQAERPLAEIVRDAVVQGLNAARAPLADASESLDLDGELLEYRQEVVMGMWSGTITSKMTVKLKLKNSATGATLWNDTFIASATLEGRAYSAEGLFRATLDNLIAQMLDADMVAKFADHVAMR